MKKRGYYIRVYNKDCFLVTDAQKRTKALALEFLNKIQNELNKFINIDDATLEFSQKRMQPAFCEIKTLNNGSQYYEIFGNNFGGCGSFVNDGNTIILNIDKEV